jgi:hypothetical protein
VGTRRRYDGDAVVTGVAWLLLSMMMRNVGRSVTFYTWKGKPAVLVVRGIEPENLEKV